MLNFSRHTVHAALFSVGVLLSFYPLTSVQGKTGVLSQDGAFTLYAPISSASSHLSRALSAYEKQFYKLTGYSPGAPPPIIVVVPDSGSKRLVHSTLRMDALAGGTPKIQIDLAEENIGNSENRLLLAQALLLREYYSTRAPTPGSPIVEFSSWVIHGLGRLSDTESKQVFIPSSYLQGAVPPSVEDLLVQKSPDVSNLALLDIYDAMCAALLSAGLKSPDSENAFRKWIGSFDPKLPQRTASCWPPNWSMKSVERQWLLTMAGMSGEDSQVIALLDVDETLHRYDEIFAEVATPQHSLSLLKKEKGSDYLIDQLYRRFLALRLQANPLVVSLLDETIQLCTKLRRLPEKKIMASQKTLSDTREEIQKRYHSIDAYLDWFEATKLPMKSGLFENALKEPTQNVKKGPVGRYLDTIEARGW